MSRVASLALRGAIRAYQLLVSPLLGPHCRFAPSCSEYAREAIERHGVAVGLRLATARVARCHPRHDGGFDPVPPTAPPRDRGQRALRGTL